METAPFGRSVGAFFGAGRENGEGAIAALVTPKAWILTPGFHERAALAPALKDPAPMPALLKKRSYLAIEALVSCYREGSPIRLGLLLGET